MTFLALIPGIGQGISRCSLATSQGLYLLSLVLEVFSIFANLDLAIFTFDVLDRLTLGSGQSSEGDRRNSLTLMQRNHSKVSLLESIRALNPLMKEHSTCSFTSASLVK